VQLKTFSLAGRVQALEVAGKQLEARLAKAERERGAAGAEASQKLAAAAGAQAALQRALAATEADFRVALQVPH
jgi:hypothetical protein